MSQHHYVGPAPSRGPSVVAASLAWLLALATIGLQIAFPLTDAANQPDLAVVTVYAFFLASLTHALVHRGFLGGLLVAAVVPLGLLAEVVGVRGGWLFGDYSYGDVLGTTLFGVPVVVPLAWAMMAYPTYVAAARLSHRRWLVALIGGWSLMAWDVFLDPLMVHLGGWSWHDAGPSFPGVPGVPLTNFLGWFVVGSIVTLMLTFLPRPRASIAQPATLYLWVFASSVVGNALYFDRPQEAIVGGIAMGLVACPFTWQLWEYRG